MAFMSTRALSVILVALVSAVMMLAGFYMWWVAPNPPGGTGPWVVLAIVGFFVGIGAAVALGITVARRD